MGVKRTVLKKCAIWTNRLLWTVLVSSLIVVATFVSIGRYYINYVEQYQHDLIARFASYTGLPISATRLYGRWSKLSPILTMEDLVLYSMADGLPILTIDEISFKLDPLESLLSLRLQVNRLNVSGVYCELEEVQSAKWQLKGYPAKQGETDFDKIIDLILSADQLSLRNATLAMSYHNGTTAALESKEVSLQHDNGFRRLKLQATFDKADNPLFAVIEAHGDPRAVDDFSAKAYLKLDDVDFTDQLPLIRSLGINLNDAKVDSEVWVDWQPNRVISIQGEAAIPEVDWAAISGGGNEKNQEASAHKKPLLKNIQLSFRAEKSANDHWQLWLPSIHAQWSTQTLRIEKLYAKINTETLDVALPSIELDSLVKQIMDLHLLSEKAELLLGQLSPVGKLQDLHINIGLEDTANPRFLLKANLEQVGISAWKGAPGAKGVDGYIEFTPSYGLVEFNSQQLSLDFPVVYRQGLDFNAARGQVRWDIGSERIIVKSGPLYLQAEFGPATGLLNLDLPVKGNSGDPMMTLAIGVRDMAASHRKQLIPYTLNPAFLTWMAQSVPQGHVIDGAFIYRGSLLKHAASDRTVQLYFNIDNTTLDYHPNWPPLHDISGLVLIDNKQVDVTTQSAKMFGLDIESAQVQVKSLTTGGMWLTVDANATGGANDALKVITSSAIHDVVGGVFDNWVLDGESQASVTLGIPLAGAKNQADINVNVSLLDNQLHMPDFRLKFNALNGQLQFSSDKGLSSTGLRTKFYGKPVNVAVQSAKDKSVLVDINGRIDMKDVQAWSPQPALTFVSGETNFNAQVVVDPKKLSRFTVNSNLLGVEIDLPEPLKKSKDQLHNFSLAIPLDNRQTLLDMTLENVAQLQMILQKGVLSSALLNIQAAAVKNVAESAPILAHEPGIFLVTGKGPHVELDVWQLVLERYLKVQQSYANTASADVAVHVKDLLLDSVTGFGRNFDQTEVSAHRRGESWWVAIKNSVSSGELIIPDDRNKPYVVDLQKLYFTEGEAKDDLSSVDPTQFADIDISVADVAFGNEHYGSIAFNLRSDSNGARLENLVGNIRGAHIRTANPGLMLWKRVGGATQSQIIVELDVGDLGKLLNNWNYENIIESKSGRIRVDLKWLGGPEQWELKKSEGIIDLNIDKGRFFAASETASGTLKVVGIVNLANIVRRLKLDFSDFYKSGISFDEMTGQLILADGSLSIKDQVVIESPSSGFSIRGNADLEQQLLDMEMIVTLPVVNNLPWIAALAGGLPTAAGVFVASKIFEEQFNQLSSAVYTVSGDWNDPTLKFKRVFDQKRNSKDKSKNTKNEKNTLE